jgi:hypothetical protein
MGTVDCPNGADSRHDTTQPLKVGIALLKFGIGGDDQMASDETISGV